MRRSVERAVGSPALVPALPPSLVVLQFRLGVPPVRGQLQPVLGAPPLVAVAAAPGALGFALRVLAAVVVARRPPTLVRPPPAVAAPRAPARRRRRSRVHQVLDVVLALDVVATRRVEVVNSRFGRHPHPLDHVLADEVPRPIDSMRAVDSDQTFLIFVLLQIGVHNLEKLSDDILGWDDVTGAEDLLVQHRLLLERPFIIVTHSVGQVDHKRKVRALVEKVAWGERQFLFRQIVAQRLFEGYFEGNESCPRNDAAHIIIRDPPIRYTTTHFVVLELLYQHIFSYNNRNISKIKCNVCMYEILNVNTI